MVLHSKNDTLFLGYGRDARDWWVGCKGCSTSAKTMADGCLAYTGCKDSTEVQYCESGGSHGTWPKVNGSILAFFGRFRRAGK